MLDLHLRDINPDVVAAWRTSFQDAPEVQISQGSILALNADAIVSPANSFGYMDGGIDLAYCKHFGWELENKLRAAIAERHYGELPVGQALIIATGISEIPFLISAPTMRVPSSISRTVNVYLAFRAALIAIREHNKDAAKPIRSVLAPGMGTGVGEVPPPMAARQMKIAYDAIIRERSAKARNAGQIWGEHHELLSSLR